MPAVKDHLQNRNMSLNCGNTKIRSLGDGCPSGRRRAAAIGIKVNEIVRLKVYRLWIIGLTLFGATGRAAAVAAL
jgi:hypothetical protein